MRGGSEIGRNGRRDGRRDGRHVPSSTVDLRENLCCITVSRGWAVGATHQKRLRRRRQAGVAYAAVALIPERQGYRETARTTALRREWLWRAERAPQRRRDSDGSLPSAPGTIRAHR